jgi:hypothetical protein
MPARMADSRDFRDSFFIGVPHLWKNGKTERLANQPFVRRLSVKRCKRAICFIRDAAGRNVHSELSPVWVWLRSLTGALIP